MRRLLKAIANKDDADYLQLMHCKSRTVRYYLGVHLANSGLSLLKLRHLVGVSTLTVLCTPKQQSSIPLPDLARKLGYLAEHRRVHAVYHTSVAAHRVQQQLDAVLKDMAANGRSIEAFQSAVSRPRAKGWGPPGVQQYDL